MAGQQGFAQQGFPNPGTPQPQFARQQGGFGPAPVRPQRRKGRMPLLVVGGIIGVVVLAVIAVLAISYLNQGRSTRDLVFHPQGPSTQWLDPGYADGFHQWQTDEVLYGVSSDRSTIAAHHADYADVDGLTVETVYMLGLDVRTGEERWRLEGVKCAAFPVYDGTAYCARTVPAGIDLVAIDLGTGDEQVFYEAPPGMVAVQPIGVLDTSIIASASDAENTLLLSFGNDGVITWNTLIEGGASDCYLLGTHLGCENLESLTVLDATTGEVTVEATPIDYTADEVEWFTDGYAITAAGITMEAVDYPLYDFTGAQVGLAEPQTPLFPNSSDRIFYPLSDAQHEGSVQSIDASGTVVSEYRNGGVTLQPGGRVFREFGATVHAVSADGSVLLFETEAGLAIHNREGDELHSFDFSPYDLQLLDGLVVTGNPGQPTTVWAPGP